MPNRLMRDRADREEEERVLSAPGSFNSTFSSRAEARSLVVRTGFFFFFFFLPLGSWVTSPGCEQSQTTRRRGDRTRGKGKGCAQANQHGTKSVASRSGSSGSGGSGERGQLVECGVGERRSAAHRPLLELRQLEHGGEELLLVARRVLLLCDLQRRLQRRRVVPNDGAVDNGHRDRVCIFDPARHRRGCQVPRSFLLLQSRLGLHNLKRRLRRSLDMRIARE